MACLSKRDEEMPDTVEREKTATNLASLTLSPGLIQIRDVVLSQWRKTDAIARLAKHGIHPIRQLFFYGPPGNGKTIASQWIAKDFDVPLFRVRCEMLVSSYHGATAQNMSKTLRYLEDVGPAIVLFDEIETLFQSRELAGHNVSQERHAAMATLWQSLDRWSTPQLFIFATNLESKMDAAMMSRFELQLYFGPPTQEQCCSVIDYWSEVFHEFGSDEWARELKERRHVSCRALWQAITEIVRFRALV